MRDCVKFITLSIYIFLGSYIFALLELVKILIITNRHTYQMQNINYKSGIESLGEKTK